jgi:hypothetical protein
MICPASHPAPRPINRNQIIPIVITFPPAEVYGI